MSQNIEHQESDNNTFKITDEIVSPQDIPGTPQSLIHKLSCVHGVKILCKLTRNVQKHRGASIACINGDTKFLSLTDELAHQIDRLFSLLIHQQNQHCFVPQEQIISALNDWQTIKQGWKKDTVILNYELHCHLVDMFSRMTKNCIKECLVTSRTDETDPNHFGILAVLIDVPENIEQLAKLRGLATHVSVSGICDHDSSLRLSFLHDKCIRDDNRLYHTLSKLKGGFANIQALQALPRKKHLLDDLLHVVRQGILDSEQVTADAQQIFQLATQIIDIYWQVVEQGLLILEDTEFDNYLNFETNH